MTIDIDNLRDTLDRVVQRVDEARAATELIGEGDATALRELDAVVDDIAGDVAELKAQTGATRL